MEAKVTNVPRDANVLNQPIHLLNWMDSKPYSIIPDINQRKDEMDLMAEPLPHHPILFSENNKSSIELSSSQQCSSSPPKVVYTSTEVPGDNVDSPLSYPYSPEQLEESHDLHVDDYTAVMYENAENDLKLVPEHQGFYGLVNLIGNVDHTPGTTLTSPLGDNLDSLLSNPYYNLPEDQEDDLFDINGFVNDPCCNHPRPTSTSVSGDSEGSNHSYPLPLGLEETGNP